MEFHIEITEKKTKKEIMQRPKATWSHDSRFKKISTKNVILLLSDTL